MNALDLQEPEYHFWCETSRYEYYRTQWMTTGSAKALQEMLTYIRYQPHPPSYRDIYGTLIPGWKKADTTL